VLARATHKLPQMPELTRVPRLSRRACLQGASVAAASVALERVSRAAPPGSEPVRRGLINVSLNENPFGPSPFVSAALSAGLHDLDRYTNADETRAFTRQIAELEGVPDDQVLLGDVLEALGLHLGLRGGSGGEFLYSVPGYPALVEAAQPVGGVGVPIPLNDKLENDLATFRARQSSRTRAIFLVNPHNPSGTVSDVNGFKDQVSDLAKRSLVIVDEAYLDYTDDAAQRTLAERVRSGDNVVVLRTFSKLHALASLPFGYALGPSSLLDELRQRGVGSPRSLNRLAVRAAAASLRDPKHLARVRAQVAVERARWHQVLESLNVRHSDARASFVFFENSRSQAQIASALAAEGIDIGRSFPPFLNWTRISIGLPTENQRVQAALRRLLS
jgi:histidinol-phosphate aminotransferase